MTFQVTAVKLGKQSFRNDLEKLPPEVKAVVGARMADLIANPRLNRLRLHDLSGHKPKIFKIDLSSSGKMYQATFHLEGSVAVFLRAGTHKQIDRCPK